MAVRLDNRQEDFETEFAALLASKREVTVDVADTVSSILADVRSRGDAAILELTARFDGLFADSMDALAVSGEDIDAALDGLTELRDALETAAARIRAFHEKQVPEGFDYRDDAGVELGMRFSPVDAAGLYVPGGKAAYPSSVLMNAIPQPWPASRDVSLSCRRLVDLSARWCWLRPGSQA